MRCALREAGATMIVLEAIPAVLAPSDRHAAHHHHRHRCRQGLLGPGSGRTHDAFDIRRAKAKFVRNFMDGASSIADAACRAVAAVRTAATPARNTPTPPDKPTSAKTRRPKMAQENLLFAPGGFSCIQPWRSAIPDLRLPLAASSSCRPWATCTPATSA